MYIRKLVLFVACYIVFLALITGCASSGINPSETTTAPSVESTAPSVTEPPADPYRGVYVGMTFYEFVWTIPETDWSNYLDYYYLVNANGDYVVFTFEEDKIADLQVCPKPVGPVTGESLKQLEEGMTFYQIVSLIGLPDQISGSGIVRMNYYTDDGLHYSFTLHYADLTLLYIYPNEYPVPSRLGDEKHCGLAVGMQADEFHYIISETQFFNFGYGIESNDFAFLRNADGDHVIAQTYQGVFTRVECYDADTIDRSPESFESIPVDADLFTVVSKVGIPHNISYGSDQTRDLCYLASDGTKYVIEVRRVFETPGDDATDVYVVKEVRLYEET